MRMSTSWTLIEGWNQVSIEFVLNSGNGLEDVKNVSA